MDGHPHQQVQNEPKSKVLYNAQSYAVENNTNIDYSGIDKIDLEISQGFKSIPLAEYNDFCGVEFNVTNNWKNVPLFEMGQPVCPIMIEKKDLDGRRFTAYSEFRRGEFLLVIKDNNPWMDQRVGHSHGHERRDVLLIRNGKSQNSVISAYNNSESNPECSYCQVTGNKKFIKNFTLNRASGSTFMTFCVYIHNQAHVRLKNITLNTPKSGLFYDMAFRVYDAVDVVFENVAINGTYSQSDKYGYGLCLNNVWKASFNNVRGNGVWGVIGNNNLSDTYLNNCRLNRFDIHCYGRNYTLKNCVFDGGEKGCIVEVHAFMAH